MLLFPDDGRQFSRLYFSLLGYVNQRLGVLPTKNSTYGDISELNPSERLALRDALLDHLELYGEYVDENPDQLTDDELDIVEGWQDYVEGSFLLIRETPEHTLMLLMDEEPELFGVVAHSMPFSKMIPPPWPKMVQTLLLPFKGIIVYDTLLMHEELTELELKTIRFPSLEMSKYLEANDEVVKTFDLDVDPNELLDSQVLNDLVTSFLEFSRSNKPKKKKAVKKQAPKAVKKPLALPDTLPAQQCHDEVVALIKGFCSTHLNDEYAVLCLQAVDKLARKKSHLLSKGKANAWACGIVRAIGNANFLGDKSFLPYMKVKDIDKYFSVGNSTAGAKTREIEKLLGISAMDYRWNVPSFMEMNDMIWYVQIDGFIRDIRQAPRSAQVEAFELGLIPYIPADRKSSV